jgi:hypothetical protein
MLGQQKATQTVSGEKPVYQVAAEAIAAVAMADVLLVNSPIRRPLDQVIMDLARKRRRLPNVVLLLTTEGGDPDAAFRIARCLQDNYETFRLLVGGYCKSAGTLVALGAKELIIADCGELGPLDVQMSKPDELAQMQSGLTATSALTTLHAQAFQAFENFFLQLVARSGSAISTRTATQIAVQLACGLFSPIYGHVDPMHVGEAGRALSIAQKYGQLLNDRSENLKARSLNELATNYPSHGFVIDRMGASKLFNAVRKPNDGEQMLLDALQSAVIEPVTSYEAALVAYLNQELPEPQNQPLPGIMEHPDHAVQTETATTIAGPAVAPEAGQDAGTSGPDHQSTAGDFSAS